MTTQLSTTRERTVQIEPNSVLQVDFADTKPNHFYLNNLSATDVYMGVNMIPDSLRYDLYVGPSSQQVTGREQGTTHIYLYNASPNKATLSVMTLEKEFDPTVLIGVSTGGAGTVTRPSTVTVNGFSVPLPNGSNKVGRVDVETLPPLPVGNNKIGKVEVTNPIEIASMPPLEVTNDPVRAYHHMFDSAVGNSVVTVDFTPRNVTKFSYITNDDATNDLFIAFNDDTLTTSPGNGYNGVIRLKPGESLSDLGRMATKIKFTRAAGNGHVRMLGV